MLDAAGRKLGYLARIDNSAVARMIDAGERFEARGGLTPPLGIRVVVDWGAGVTGRVRGDRHSRFRYPGVAIGAF